jgi:hypothetical protein
MIDDWSGEEYYETNPRDLWVYYLPNVPVVDAYSPLKAGSEIANCFTDIYEQKTVFVGNTVFIKGHFSVLTPLDSIVICGKGITKWGLKLFSGALMLCNTYMIKLVTDTRYISRIYSSRINTEGNAHIVVEGNSELLPIPDPDNAIHIINFEHGTEGAMFEAPYAIDRFELYIEADGPVEINYLYLGMRVGLCRPGTDIKAGTKLLSSPTRSASGQVFGLKKTFLKTLALDFPFVTEADSKSFEHYIQTVQNVTPHIIDAFWESHDAVETMFCTLDADALNLSKLTNPIPWFWEGGNLSWLEAK